jgi:hypothetical protein
MLSLDNIYLDLLTSGNPNKFSLQVERFREILSRSQIKKSERGREQNPVGGIAVYKSLNKLKIIQLNE